MLTHNLMEQTALAEVVIKHRRPCTSFCVCSWKVNALGSIKSITVAVFLLRHWDWICDPQRSTSQVSTSNRPEVAADNRWNKHSCDLEFSIKVETEPNNLLRSESMQSLRAGFHWLTEMSIKWWQVVWLKAHSHVIFLVCLIHLWLQWPSCNLTP